MVGMTEQTLRVTPLPALDSNYIWLIDNGTHAAVVDPGDATVVRTELQKRSLSLSAVLLTHRHEDHIRGTPALVNAYEPSVYGSVTEDIPVVNRPVEGGDTIRIEALGLALSVLGVPGHTKGHIAFYSRLHGWLFCGDMLSGAGCGRMFEGTPEMMIASLGKMMELPDETLVFSAHEYTLPNLKFALEIEPKNPDILQRIRDDTARRERKQPTMPSTIGLEKKTNPFFRFMEPELQEHLISLGLISSKNPVHAFASMREWRNIYR